MGEGAAKLLLAVDIVRHDWLGEAERRLQVCLARRAGGGATVTLSVGSAIAREMLAEFAEWGAKGAESLYEGGSGKSSFFMRRLGVTLLGGLCFGLVRGRLVSVSMSDVASECAIAA